MWPGLIETAEGGGQEIEAKGERCRGSRAGGKGKVQRAQGRRQGQGQRERCRMYREGGIGQTAEKIGRRTTVESRAQRQRGKGARQDAGVSGQDARGTGQEAMAGRRCEGHRERDIGQTADHI